MSFRLALATPTRFAARRTFATSALLRADTPNVDPKTAQKTENAADAFKAEGKIGSKFNADGEVGSKAQEVGGPFSADGVVGRQFTKDGAIGGLGQAVAEAVSGKAEETKKDNQK